MSNKIDGRFAKSVGNFKNKIINGGFDVWQRGESYTVDASDLVNHPPTRYSTADRFITGSTDTGSATLGVYTAAKEVFEDKNWFKQTCGTPLNSTDYITRSLVTLLEAPDNVSNIKGKTVTLSFLFRAKTPGQYSVAIGDYTDDNFTIFSFNYTGGTQKCSCTFTVPNVTPDNNMSLKIYFSYGVDDTDIRISDDTNLNGVFNNSATLTRTSDYKWWTVAGDWVAYTEIQLEEGSVATEFEQRPLSIEQMLCYRYYEEGTGTIGHGDSSNNGVRAGTSSFIVSKRVAATITSSEFTHVNGGVTATSSSPVTFIDATKGGTFVVLLNAYTIGYSYYIHWEADAEL